jgi:hypothetical protein
LSTGIFTMTKSKLSIQWGIRCSLLAAIGGMMAYSYLSLDFQANHIYLEKTGFLGIVIVLLIGLGIGWLIGWFWYRNFRSRGNKT